MITKKVLITVLALALLSPGSVLAAYTPYPGQVLDIKRSSVNPPLVDIKFSELLSISGTNLTVSIFGNIYTLNAATAQFLDAARNPLPKENLVIGDRINVYGTLDAADSSLVHAQIVRAPRKGGGGLRPPDLPPPPPPGDDPENPPDEPLPPGQQEPSLWDANYRFLTTGEPQDSDPLVQSHRWKPGLDLSNWNGGGGAVGSQNLPLLAEAAAGNYKFFEELARLQKREGIFGREFGSPEFYFSAPMVAKMVALRTARDAGDTVAAAEIAADMKATWTIWALATIPGGRTSSSLKSGAVTYTGAPDSFQGAATAVAGERWGSKVPPEALNSDSVSPLAAWALDLPRSHLRDVNRSGNLLSVPERNSWWDSIAARVMGVNDYRATTQPEFWGLTAADREALRRIVLQGSTSGLNAALATIRDRGGLWHSLVVRIRRTTEGVETVYFRATNGNKPAQAVTSVTHGGAWNSMRPCFLNKVGSNVDYRVWIENGVVNATGDPTQCAHATQPELGGNVVYSVVIRGDSVTQGNVTSADGPTDPGSVAPPPGGGLPPDDFPRGGPRPDF